MTLAAADVSAALSARQVLLLQATLLPGAQAIQAWRQWQRGPTIEALELDSQWLLPLLYCNLRQAGVAEGPLRRYANVYRHNWYKNQMLLRAAGRALADAGAPVLLLGGTAMAAGYYPLLGARPIEHVTVFCSEPGPIREHLTAAGWQAAKRETSNALALTDSLGRCIELTSTLLSDRHDAALLARARPLRVGGAGLLVLEALDQLALVLAARDAWDNRSRLLWAADAAQILRRDPTLHEDALFDRARELSLGPPVTESWRVLHNGYGLAGAEQT